MLERTSASLALSRSPVPVIGHWKRWGCHVGESAVGSLFLGAIALYTRVLEFRNSKSFPRVIEEGY